MTSILNNTSALAAARQLSITGNELNSTIQRLTTGKRINTSADDPAGLAISSKLNSDIQIAGQAQRNTNDGVSYLQVADGALDEVTNLLTTAAQLAEQAQTGTISASNRADLDAEFQNILYTLGNIGTNTNFNGQAIFSTSAQSFTVEAGDYGALTVNFAAITSSSIAPLGLTVGTNALTTTAAAAIVATLIANALASVSTIRASIGANEAELNATSDILGVQVQNFTAAYGNIVDANIADEVVNLTQEQILQQSGTSALAKSNTASQQILALLQ